MFGSRAIRLALVASLFGAGSCDSSSGGSSGADTVICGAAECKIIASDGVTGDIFGSSVSIAADKIAVGAPLDDDNGGQSGAVYIYRQIGAQWIEEQKLVPSDGAAGDYFGAAVAVDASSADGDLIVVGARFRDETQLNSGSVYVYRFNTSTSAWEEEQRLEAADATAQAAFGSSVDVEDDLIVIGASKDTQDGVDAGSVYVFRYNGTNWVQDPKVRPNPVVLDPSDTDPGDPINVRAADHFGTSVGIDKDDAMNPNRDVIVVGTPGDDVLIQRYDESQGEIPNADWKRAGTVYVFRFDGTNWVQEDRVIAQRFARIQNDGIACTIRGTTPPVAETTPQPDVRYHDQQSNNFRFLPEESNNAQFGVSVSVDAGVLVVGASSHDRLRGANNPCSIRLQKGRDSGSGYVYRYDSGSLNWEFESQLEVADNAAKRFLGESIEVNRDTIVMSSRKDDETALDAGAAYVFRYNQFGNGEWLEDEKLRASDGQTLDAFGGSVALDGSTAVVGADSTTVVGPQSGSAYAIDIAR